MTLVSSESLRNFYAPPYEELKKINLGFKAGQVGGKNMKDEVLKFLKTTGGIKAIMVAFADLEGKLHTLDYDKDFFLGGYENLTFDGSSIRGFTAQAESDLRLFVDFGSFRVLPADIFGAGKAIVFCNIGDKDGSPYSGDFRSQLVGLTAALKKKHGYTVYCAPEIEGFIFKGTDAEQRFTEERPFELVTMGGYFNTLPQDELRLFIDRVAEAQRALGFENEKDHPEVAPSQFEINFKYSDVVVTADTILLYKLICRLVAKSMGYTASFLPKPVVGINGSGMHSNMSFANNGGKNIFYDADGEDGISEIAHNYITGILYHAKELCLTICSSVNSYRRLDPHFEAPNEIKKSACDRGSMVRIPLANEKSARIEVRSVAPDANPYLAYFAIISAGMDAINADKATKEKMEKAVYKKEPDILFDNITDAVNAFEASDFMKKIMLPANHAKYVALKREAAERSPKLLGKIVKKSEVIYHHDVFNQILWNNF